MEKEQKKENKSLFRKVKGFFKENEWSLGLVIVTIVALTLDTIGFKMMFEQNNLTGNWGDYIYYSIRVFGFDLQTPAIDTPIPWVLEIGRWLSGAVTVWAIMLAVQEIFKDKWRLLRKGKGHIVIVGAGSKGKTLGIDWIKNTKDLDHEDYGKLVVFIEKDKNNSNVDILKDEGAIFVFGDGSDEQVLQKAKVDKAHYFVTVTSSDATNMEIVSTLTKLSSSIENKIKCYIHILHNEFYDFFMAKGFADNKKLDIKIFNINSNAARMLFSDENHLLGSNVFDSSEDIKDSNKKVKIAIFGFGKLGESILVHALHLGHFYNGVPLEVTVVYDDDKDENKNLLDEFEKQYDILKPQHNGKYWNVKFIDDGKFKDENICDYSQIIIAYEDEFESLSNLMKLLKKYNDEILSKNIDISIYSNSFASTANIIQTDKDNKNHTVFKQVRTFGEINKTCSYNMVVNQILDKKAEKNHYQYEELHNAVTEGWAKPWEQLDMFLKDSNRYLMEHNEIKKFLISKLIDKRENINTFEDIQNSIEAKYFNYDGMNINWKEMELENHDYALKLSEEEIVQLAKVEHIRWNAFHILNGWKKLDIPEGTKNKIKKDPVRKLHPCLVSWDELDKVSKNHDHNYKSDDIQTIMRIPRLEKILKK